METLAYLHHSTAHESPDEYEVTLDLSQVNLDNVELGKLSGKGAMYLLAASCGITVMTASSEAQALLRFGDSGSDVYSLQVDLINAGYSIPNGPSYYFGSQTESAVRSLQADCGISVDGIVGPSTESCLGGEPPSGGGVLRFGDSGSDVYSLQVALINAGFSVPGGPTNYFGYSTDSAVRSLQASCGIVVDGIVGPSTRACLSDGGDPPTGGATLRFGDTGAAVVELQTTMIELGYLGAGLATGYFGTQTQSAVIAFQRDCGLVADGIVGPATRACIADEFSGV